MQKIYIKDIVELYNGKLICGNEDVFIQNISIDSRTADEKSIFFGIKTTKSNGSDYLAQALEKGVKGAVVDHCDLKLKDETVVVVDDVKKVLEEITNLKRKRNPEKKVIAITGSVGKTTTKNLIAQVLQTKYNVNKTKGNFNNDLGVPISFLQTFAEDISVIEMGMNHRGEIDKLSHMVEPDLAIITNIGTSHIGNLGSKENIFRAKMEILNGMKNKALVINNDDEYLSTIKGENVYTYGIENSSDIMAKNIKTTPEYTSFDVQINDKIYKVKSPLLGIVSVYNILCALRVALLYNVAIEDAIKSIENLKSEDRRLNIDLKQNGIKVIDDSYNSSPESVKNALKFLENFKDANTYAILGDMLEQGELTEQLHNEVGQSFKNLKIKNAIFIGDNAKYMYDGFKKSSSHAKAKYFKTKQEAMEYLDTKLKPFDVVLVKASNLMKFNEIVKHIENIKFSSDDILKNI